MNFNFSLPSWMSLDVAHSHVMLLKLAAELPERDDDVGYFLNSEEALDTPLDFKGDIPKNRSIQLNLEVDADGTIKE